MPPLTEKYQKKEWLENEYIRANKSSREIAEICNVSKTTILRWLNRLGIPKHPSSLNREYRDYEEKNYQSSDWLYLKYVDEKLTGEEIAEIEGVSKPTIFKALRHNDIEVRASNPANHLEISNDLYDLLTGLILGDGSLSKPVDISSKFMNADSFKDYLEWLDEIFSDFGIEKMGRIFPTSHENGSTSWTYQTLKYYEFGPLYNKFYPDEEKVIPPDFSLTPTNLLFWFIGDGCRSQHAVQIGIFKLEGEILREALQKEGISASLQNEGNIVNILTESWSDFYDYMSRSEYYNSIPKSYWYKFPNRGDFHAAPYT